MNKGIVLFSGGRDSTLAAYYAASHNPTTEWNLVTYDNHNLIGSNKRGGPEEAYRELKSHIDNITSHEVIPYHFLFRAFSALRAELNIQQYGFSTICLDCRAAMYIKSVLLADERGYTTIVDGARRSQRYTEQLPEAINPFKEFLKGKGIELLTPVYNIEDDECIAIRLVNKGLSAHNYELQCLWKRNMARLPESDIIRKYVEEELIGLMDDSIGLLRNGGKVPELEDLVIKNNIKRREK
jgi:tRNA(Ile)-lysidine synthase TilS/MesJ